MHAKFEKGKAFHFYGTGRLPQRSRSARERHSFQAKRRKDLLRWKFCDRKIYDFGMQTHQAPLFPSLFLLRHILLRPTRMSLWSENVLNYLSQLLNTDYRRWCYSVWCHANMHLREKRLHPTNGNARRMVWHSSASRKPALECELVTRDCFWLPE